MLVDGKSFAVAETSGKYTAELDSVYAKEAQRACKSVSRQQYKGVETELHVLAKQSALGKAATVAAGLQVFPAVGPCAATFREYMILPQNEIVSVDDCSSGVLSRRPFQSAIRVATRQIESWQEAEEKPKRSRTKPGRKRTRLPLSPGMRTGKQ